MGGAAIVFVSGLSVMVLELVAGRLVAPYFGQSTCTWAALTGVTLAGVSMGNALGGWISAKLRRPGIVAAVALIVGGALCAALPYILPIIGCAIEIFAGFETKTAAFVIAAWLPPMLALGCVTPSIAAACVRPERNGRDLGVLYFASMAGSALGSVLGGLWLPFSWPADTLYVFFGLLLALNAVVVSSFLLRHDVRADTGHLSDVAATLPCREGGAPSACFFLAVFIVGWFGMGIELAGARLVTPILGGNHIVWSLIFITFIGSMGIGGWLGGLAADRWPRIETVLFTLVALAAVSCATVWAQMRLLPDVLAEAGATTRLLGFIVVAFSPLGVMLGAASTVLLKFSTADALRRGNKSIVGFMYATASAGSVFGTFITGFALVGKIGSAALCILLSAALVLTALFIARRFGVWGLGGDLAFRSSVALTLALTAVVHIGWFRMPQLPQEVRMDDGWKLLSASESRYNVVTVSALADNENVRTVWLDRIPHTTIDMNRRDELSTSYTRMIDTVVLGALRNEDSPSLFMIGGGGYALPRKWTSSGRKWRRLVVAEIDGAVTDAALRFLDATPDETNGVWYAEGDGRRVLDELLAQGEHGTFDIVVGDTISDAAIPYHLATLEFNGRIKSLMKPDGLYVMHLLDKLENPALLSSILRTLSRTWRNVGAIAYQQIDDVRQSFVVFASDDESKVDVRGYAEAVGKAYPDSWPLAIDGEYASRIMDCGEAMLLTDNFAPMEKFVWDVVFNASDKRAESESERAKRLLRAGDHQGALKVIEGVLSKTPEFPAAISALRSLLEDDPGNEKAFDLLQAQARRKSAGFIAQAAYASVLAQKADFAGAERELAILRRRFPKRHDFAVGWAINAAKCGKREAAKEWLKDNRRHFGVLEYRSLSTQIGVEDD